MAFVIADRVRETSTTIGTGNFTLAGAVDRFRTFDSVLDTGDTTYYTIADQSGVGWEVGIATFTSPSTLARTTILSSSNGGSAVDFGAGSKDVFITLPASRTVISFSGGSTGLTPSTASYGAISLGGTLVAANGGTGQSSYTIGDLLYASGTTALSKLADVAIGSALISGGVGTAPSWGKIGLTTHVSGTLPVANGGTGTTTAFTAGSVVFAGASGVYAQDNASLFFDDTNNRLGIGTSSPATTLDVNGTISARANGAEGGQIEFNNPDNASQGATLDVSTADVTRWFTVRNNSTHQMGQLSGTGGTVSLYTAAAERLRLDASGNLLFNSGYGSVANAYGCRAWVNFNGDGTIAIRGSAGVTSLTDNGTGQYTINLSFTMPDSNYAVVGSAGSTNNAIGDRQLSTYPVNTTSCKVVSGQTASTAVYDATQVHVAIFR
jgi:hypothetical protein